MLFSMLNLFISEVDEKTDLKQMYANLDWDDMWHDAEMISFIKYLRESKLLEIPPEWRPYLPTEL